MDIESSFFVAHEHGELDSLNDLEVAIVVIFVWRSLGESGDEGIWMMIQIVQFAGRSV